MTEDFDPATVPVRHAATVMLVDDRPDLQVYMMKRHAKTVFAGGMWVFPGGRVDEEDHTEEMQALCPHLSDAEASRKLGLDHGGLAYYVAAIREAFEEAGILMARHRNTGKPLDLSDEPLASRFQQHRDDINDSNKNFIELMEEEGLVIDAEDMHYTARWITPLGSPRRFDARFFVSRMPRGQTAFRDNGELVDCAWLSPKEVLKKYDAGEITMISPTLRMVKNLALFDSADDIISAASADIDFEEARVHKDTRIIVMPGEAGYEDGLVDVETGWVRLRPLP